MHLDLVDVLRCEAPHADSWLVCATTVVRGRALREGWLSCPVCHRQLLVQDGAITYGEAPAPAALSAAPDASDVVQLAAALDLTRPGLLVVLAGNWSEYADALDAMVPTRLILMDPPQVPLQTDAGIRAVVRGARGVPLPTAQVHAVALDAAHADSDRLRDAHRVLRAGGRLILPAGVALPAELSLLAEDARMRVGVAATAPPIPIPLRRRA